MQTKIHKINGVDVEFFVNGTEFGYKFVVNDTPYGNSRDLTIDKVCALLQHEAFESIESINFNNKIPKEQQTEMHLYFFGEHGMQRLPKGTFREAIVGYK